MNNVISEKQAREITGGRKPLVPVVYEQALKALASCINIDDAKEWDNKADALAAWAKIYHDGKVERQAKQLKLLAYRRMGQLAKDIRPRQGVRGKPGARDALRLHGMTVAEAAAAVALSKLSESNMQSVLSAKSIRSPTVLNNKLIRDRNFSESMIWLTDSNSVRNCASRMRQKIAVAIANDIRADEYSDARKFVLEIYEWCDDFIRAGDARHKNK